MQVMKWSVMALAIAAATSQMAYADDQDTGTVESAAAAEENLSSQAKSNGFLEDSTLTLLNRNFAFYRNLENNGPNGQNYRNEWAHGFLTDYSSGYTQGVVGFGIDAFANAFVRLNSGGGTSGTGLLPLDSTGHAQEEYGIAGGAVKARISETELKVGELRPESPVFGYSDSRMNPQNFTGQMILSNEIKDLALQAGHFYSGNAQPSTNSHDELGTAYGWTPVDSADYLGGEYTFSDDLSFGLHAAKYEDVWNQYFADLNHTMALGDDMSLSTSLNYYNTQDTGDAKAGEISTNAYSASFALAVGAQTFTLAHQRVNGDTPFDYLGVGNENNGFDAAGSIWLSNSVQYSDFNGPGEKSYQARYDLDMGALGVPGLSFMARYITGNGIDGSNADVNGAYTGIGNNGDEWERDLQVAYVIQEGPAKDLSFKVRQATWRANQDAAYFGSGGGTALDEVRIITEYPLDIL